MRILAAAVLIVAFTSISVAAPPRDDLVRRVTDAIRKHCPEAAIERTKDCLSARHGTMIYTVHSVSKIGKVSETPHQEEGPNFQGFMLSVSLEQGEYVGAAKVPQTLQGPYFPTFIDAVAIEDGKSHYLVHFSYGSRLDPELKKAIFEALPQRASRQGGEPDAKAQVPRP